MRYKKNIYIYIYKYSFAIATGSFANCNWVFPCSSVWLTDFGVLVFPAMPIWRDVSSDDEDT